MFKVLNFLITGEGLTPEELESIPEDEVEIGVKIYMKMMGEI